MASVLFRINKLEIFFFSLKLEHLTKFLVLEMALIFVACKEAEMSVRNPGYTYVLSL